MNGHWPVGATGGEEQHILTITEMPSHNHQLNGWTIQNGYSGPGHVGDPKGFFSDVTQYTGGNQPHNILPRFITLAYIMKL